MSFIFIFDECDVDKVLARDAAAIAQWIRLHLPSLAV